jgi:hypothetical protein
MCLANLLGLALFVAAHRRQASRQKELLRQTRDDFQEAINQILDRYQELRGQVSDTAEEDPGFEMIAGTTPAASIPAVAAVGDGMNFSRRAMILRLHRQGESPARIAAAVGLPKAQVELLVKVHATSGWMTGETEPGHLSSGQTAKA